MSHRVQVAVSAMSEAQRRRAGVSPTTVPYWLSGCVSRVRPAVRSGLLRQVAERHQQPAEQGGQLLAVGGGEPVEQPPLGLQVVGQGGVQGAPGRRR